MDQVRTPPFVVDSTSIVKAFAQPWQNREFLALAADTGEGEGVKIGVADTGIDLRLNRFPNLQAARSFIAGVGAGDGNGHGTWCAGQAFSSECSASGKAQGYVAKVLGDNGGGSLDAVAAGVKWLADEGCDIISCSLGSPQTAPVMQQAFEYATAQGAICVAATGNEGAARVSFPAGYDFVPAVGAVDRQRRLAGFSNRGAVDIVYYGVGCEGFGLGGTWATLSGTSMATPGIASCIALIISAEIKWLGERRTKTVADLMRYEGFTTDLGDPGKDMLYGRGFPDLAAVVSQIKREATQPDKPTNGGGEGPIYTQKATMPDGRAGVLKAYFYPNKPSGA